MSRGGVPGGLSGGVLAAQGNGFHRFKKTGRRGALGIGAAASPDPSKRRIALPSAWPFTSQLNPGFRAPRWLASEKAAMLSEAWCSVDNEEPLRALGLWQRVSGRGGGASATAPLLALAPECFGPEWSGWMARINDLFEGSAAKAV